LVERYQYRLVAIMHHLVGSSEEAEDLAQEVFLRVFRTRHKYHPRAKFSTWLFTIANNLALNHLRSRQRRPGRTIGTVRVWPVGRSARRATGPKISNAGRPNCSSKKSWLPSSALLWMN
jgi:RNA polymerase sigma-70 factor (ECF subfamily)